MVFANWDKMTWHTIRICILLNHYSALVCDLCKKRTVHISLRIDFYGHYEHSNVWMSFLIASRLIAELAMLNLNLPARVWLPFGTNSHHHIVRIPHTQAIVLNSKEKVRHTGTLSCIYCTSFYIVKQLFHFGLPKIYFDTLFTINNDFKAHIYVHCFK